MSHKMHDASGTNRRTILKVGALASVGAIVGGGVGMTSAQTATEESLVIEVYPEEEYVEIRKTGESEGEVDLSGYSLNFDAEGGNDQIRELAEDVVLGPGEGVSVGTGAQTQAEVYMTVVDPYDGNVLADDGSDVVALLDPEGNEVARSGGEPDESVEVTVLDADTGDPIEGATVTSTCFFSTGEDGEGAVGDEGEIRETNEDGVAHLTLPPQGADGGYNSCSYEVMAEGYEGVDRSLDLDNLEDQTVELTPTEDGDGETHTATVVVTDTDGVRLEGVDVDVNTYEAGEDVAEGTTDDCGEVQFEVEDGGYQVRASHDELAQSTANMGVSVDEDVAYIINLFDTDDDEYEDPEDGRNITEPEPCEGAEVNPGDGDNTGDGDGSGDDTDDTDDGGQDDQADEDATDDSAGATDGDDPSPNTDRVDDPDEDEDIPSSEELADRTSESYESESDDDCPKN